MRFITWRHQSGLDESSWRATTPKFHDVRGVPLWIGPTKTNTKWSFVIFHMLVFLLGMRYTNKVPAVANDPGPGPAHGPGSI